MIAYLRSKRQLIADRDRYRELAIKQIDEIADLKDAAVEAADVTEIRVGQLQQSLDLADRAFDQLTEMLLEREAKFAAVVAELHKLREEIRNAELEQQPVGIHPNLAAATGAGMARPPRPRFDRTAARLRQQGMPADLADEAGDQ